MTPSSHQRPSGPAALRTLRVATRRLVGFSRTRPTPSSIIVVGPSFRFYSGIAVYTNRLALALSETMDVGVLLLRRLVPEVMFPGRQRVGRTDSTLAYDNGIVPYDGIDWYWGRSILPALRCLLEAPCYLVLQWWSASTLHTYLLLASVARLRGSMVILEFHEVQDPGEAGMPLLALYARIVLPLLLRLCRGGVVHTTHSGKLLAERYDLDKMDIEVIPHGPYDHHHAKEARAIPAGTLLFSGPAPPQTTFRILFLRADS